MPLFSEFKKNDPIGSYLVDEYINKGGMAWVVKVAGRNGRPYALKVSRVGHNAERDDANNIAVRDEAILLSQLNHSRIVRVYPIQRREGDTREDIFYAKTVIDHSEAWYFAMEYLEGGTLAQHVRKVGPLTVPETANIIGNICLGLNYLHHCGLVHLDVKTENVAFRTRIHRGEVFDPVLIDFGTAAGTIKYSEEMGTPYAMSPERIRLARGLDAPEKSRQVDLFKTEVWSIGILLYHTLTCKYPFPSNNVRKLTSQILSDIPVPIRSTNREVPEELDRFILEDCLAKDPSYRPTITEVLNMLKPYGSGPVTAVRAA